MAEQGTAPPVATSWLPMSRSDPTTTLLSLSTCYINIDDNCGLHEKEKQREYLQAWASTAPAHCRPPTAVQPALLIHSDRLGYYVPPPL